MRSSPRARRLVVASCLTVAYALFCVVASSRKALWFDELFTLYVAELPDAPTIWDRLRRGMDNHPPTSYLLSHLCLSLFGSTPFWLRFPSMVAVWIGAVALYKFVSARARPETGLATVLLLASSAVLPYAYEARSYGLMFGASCVTLRAWQRCLTPARSRVAPLWLFLCLSVALWTHYYAVLVLVPLALGELARAVDRRAIDWPTAAAIAGGGLNIAPLYRFAREVNAGFATHFWAIPGGPLSVVGVYDHLLGGLTLPAGGAIVLVAAWLVTSRRDVTRRLAPDATLRYELVAALGFLAVPIVMWVLARLVTHAYTGRYGIITVIGACVLFGWILAVAGGRVAERLALAALLVLVPLRLKEHFVRAHTAADIVAYASYATRVADRFDTTVVFDSPLDFLPAYHEDGERTESRFYHPEDADAELRFNDDDTIARAFAGLERYRDAHAPSFRSFVLAHRRFLLVSRPSFRHTWIRPRLLEEPRARLELVSVEGDMSAYWVTLGD